MKKLLILLLMSTLLLSGCITEEDLAAEWEAGYSQGKEDGYDIGYKTGYDTGVTLAYDAGYQKGLAEASGLTEQEEQAEPSTESSDSEEITVYVTDTGSKYHRASCGSLWNSCHEITLSQAVASGYGPCGSCNPPVG